MTGINKVRVWLGALAAFVVWAALDFAVNMWVLGPHYTAAQQQGHLLAAPRYGAFIAVWMLMLFALSAVIAHLYVAARACCGAGPLTALAVGLKVGFAAGFPTNFALAAWATFDRIFPLWWMIELWGGAVVAALVAGWIYRDPAPRA
jgi:hypothetical protein